MVFIVLSRQKPYYTETRWQHKGGMQVKNGMAPRWVFAGLTVALVGLGVFLLPAVAAETPAELAQLSRGEVLVRESVPEDSAPQVEAKILVSRPPDKVWKVVSNPEKLMQEEQKVKRVKVLSQSGNKQQVEFSVLMTRLLPPFNYVLLQELAPPHGMTFRRLSGSFKDIRGSWKLTPVEDGQKTILTYTLKLDPGPLVPKSMLLKAVKSDLPSMMRNAKAAIDKNS